MRFFWTYINKLFYVTFAKYLPTRTVGGLNYTVGVHGSKLIAAWRMTKLQAFYDAAMNAELKPKSAAAKKFKRDLYASRGI